MRKYIQLTTLFLVISLMIVPSAFALGKAKKAKKEAQKNSGELLYDGAALFGFSTNFGLEQGSFTWSNDDIDYWKEINGDLAGLNLDAFIGSTISNGFFIGGNLAYGKKTLKYDVDYFGEVDIDVVHTKLGPSFGYYYRAAKIIYPFARLDISFLYQQMDSTKYEIEEKDRFGFALTPRLGTLVFFYKNFGVDANLYYEYGELYIKSETIKTTAMGFNLGLVAQF